MSKDFWHSCWQEDYIPFHRNEINADLIEFFPHLAAGAKVLVPLCGKSLDMLWLNQQGYEVIGIELSQVAIEQFFADNQIDFSAKSNCYRARGLSIDLSIYCGDIFQLPITTVVDAVYDRAALIALPQKLRQAYVDKICQWMQPQASILLKTLSYSDNFEGPPYSVSEQEVQSLYHRFNLARLKQSITIQDSNSPLLARGLRQTKDTVTRLKLLSSKD